MFAVTTLSSMAKLLSCTMLYHSHCNSSNINKNAENNTKEVPNDWKAILVFNKEIATESCGLHFTEEAINDKGEEHVQLLEHGKCDNIHHNLIQGNKVSTSLYTSHFYVDKVDKELLTSCQPLSAIFANGKAQSNRTVYLDSVNGMLPVNWFELGKAMFSSTNLIVHLSIEEHAQMAAANKNSNFNINEENHKSSSSNNMTKYANAEGTDAFVAPPQEKVKRKYTKRKAQMESDKPERKVANDVDDKQGEKTISPEESATTTRRIGKRRGRPPKVKASEVILVDEEQHVPHTEIEQTETKSITNEYNDSASEIECIINRVKAERLSNDKSNKASKQAKATSEVDYSHDSTDNVSLHESRKEQKQLANNNKEEVDEEKVNEMYKKLKRKLIRKQIKEMMKELKEEHEQSKDQESIPLPKMLVDKVKRQYRKKKREAMMTDDISAPTLPIGDNSTFNSNQISNSASHNKNNMTENEKDAVQVIHDAIKRYGEGYDDTNDNINNGKTVMMHHDSMQQEREEEHKSLLQKPKRGRPRKYITEPSQSLQVEKVVNSQMQEHSRPTLATLTPIPDDEISNNEITFEENHTMTNSIS